MNKRLFAALVVGLLLGITIGLRLHLPTKVQASGTLRVDEIRLKPGEMFGNGLVGEDHSGHIGSRVFGFSCVEVSGEAHRFVLNND